jgi:D-mannonate dehydratase
MSQSKTQTQSQLLDEAVPKFVKRITIRILINVRGFVNNRENFSGEPWKYGEVKTFAEYVEKISTELRRRITSPEVKKNFQKYKNADEDQIENVVSYFRNLLSDTFPIMRAMNYMAIDDIVQQNFIPSFQEIILHSKEPSANSSKWRGGAYPSDCDFDDL